MGAGKTTVGQRCAELLDRPFLDTDELVVAATGMPFADILAAEGEAGFRRLERLAVADAAASPTPLVISCGGGAVLDADNRRTLRAHGVVVWLLASSAELWRRASCTTTPPSAARGRRQRRPRSSACVRSASPRTRLPRTCRSTPTAAPSTRSPTAVLEEYRSRGTGDGRARPTRPTTCRRRRRAGRRRLRCSAGRRRVAVVSQPGIADFHAPALLAALQHAGIATDLFLIGEGEDAKSLDHGRRPVLAPRRLGPPPRRRRRRPRRGSGGRHRRLRGVGVPPRRRRRAGPHHAARAGRRRHRRQDRGQPSRRARTSSARSTSPSRSTPTSPRWPRCRRASSAPASARSRSTRSCPAASASPSIVEHRAAAVVARDADVLTDLVAALRGDEGARGRRRPAGAHRAPGHAQPRPHARARARVGRRLRAAPRRGGGGRPRVRGCARRRARAHRRRHRRPLPQRGQPHSTCRPRCPAAR